jgi:glycerol uptake facilitator-like aquaporin
MAYFAEFLGTFFFPFVILIKGLAFATVIGLYVSNCAFCRLFGGHFNPTVSIMFLAKQEFKSATVFVGYLVAQLN